MFSAINSSSDYLNSLKFNLIIMCCHKTLLFCRLNFQNIINSVLCHGFIEKTKQNKTPWLLPWEGLPLTISEEYQQKCYWNGHGTLGIPFIAMNRSYVNLMKKLSWWTINEVLMILLFQSDFCGYSILKIAMFNGCWQIHICKPWVKPHRISMTSLSINGYSWLLLLF